MKAFKGKSTTGSNGITKQGKAFGKPSKFSANNAKQKRMQAYGDDWDAVSAECLRLAGYVCRECGKRGNRAHHIIPLSRGGRNIQANLKCLCETCHDKKHPHLKRKARMRA